METILEGWSERSDGRLTYTQRGGCCLSSTPPKREGYKVFFVACSSGTKVVWTYRKVA